MTIAVVLVLGVIWAVVLIPPIVRARAQQPRSDSVGDFHYRLRMLGVTNGTHRHRPARVSPARPAFAPRAGRPQQTATQKRRQEVLLVLVGACAITLVAAVVSRMTALFVLHLLADVLLGGYIYLLIQNKQRATEQRSKVRYLNTAYRAPAPYLAGSYAGDSRGESTGPRLVPLRRTAAN